MNNQDYESIKRSYWNGLIRDMADRELDPYTAFYYAFDRAYALGKEKETITQEEIEDTAKEFADKESVTENDWSDLYKGYCQGMKDALGKQEKGAKKSKRMCLRDKSKVCNKCHGCDIEADEWYNMSR